MIYWSSVSLVRSFTAGETLHHERLYLSRPLTPPNSSTAPAGDVRYSMRSSPLENADEQEMWERGERSIARSPLAAALRSAPRDCVRQCDRWPPHPAPRCDCEI